MAKKTFVLDTSVLIHDPEGALLAFQEHHVIVPAVCLEELDGLKHHSSKGHNAREAIRKFDILTNGDNPLNGVPTPRGGTLRVDLDGDQEVHLPPGFDPKKPDNIILLTALRLQKNGGAGEAVPVILVSKDISLRVKARSFGVNAEDYLSDRIVEQPVPESSITDAEVDDQAVSLIHQRGRKGEISQEEAGMDDDLVSRLRPHGCLRLIGRNSRKTCLAIFRKPAGKLEIVDKPHSAGMKREGIQPRNEEQAFALALASSQDATLVTLSGAAGTGKSLMALLAGWRHIVGHQRGFETRAIETESRFDHRMIIYRPTREIGAELGFLPGSLEEKLAPWQRPTLSNLMLISQEERAGGLEKMLENRTIEILPINHIRGDTVNHAFVIVDDAQNLTPHEMKAVITRVGEGTRMIITGDPTQVDVDFLDSHSNGFSHVMAKFAKANYGLYAHVDLVKGERSRLAEVAASLL